MVSGLHPYRCWDKGSEPDHYPGKLLEVGSPPEGRYGSTHYWTTSCVCEHTNLTPSITTNVNCITLYKATVGGRPYTALVHGTVLTCHFLLIFPAMRTLLSRAAALARYRKPLLRSNGVWMTSTHALFLATGQLLKWTREPTNHKALARIAPMWYKMFSAPEQRSHTIASCLQETMISMFGPRLCE